MRRAVCFWTASTTSGWQCPTLRAAAPEVKSRRRFPSASVTQTPLASYAATGEVLVVVIMYSSSAAMIARVLGPGIGVRIRTPGDFADREGWLGGGPAFRWVATDDIVAPRGSHEGEPLKRFAEAWPRGPPRSLERRISLGAGCIQDRKST